MNRNDDNTLISLMYTSVSMRSGKFILAEHMEKMCVFHVNLYKLW